jgi:signal transduction histidine kinase
MEVIAEVYKRLFEMEDLNKDITLENMILDSNQNIPMILTDKTGTVIQHIHLDPNKVNKEGYLIKKLNEMKVDNKPIVLDIQGGGKQYVYYSDSDILTNLRYYPIGLILVLFLFSLAIYFYNFSNRIAAQNKLWTGMAKETAHQIGTPLTSLMGWATLLKEDEKTKPTALELEKDIQRLEVIASRFSKIGSEPELNKADIVAFTEESLKYLESRASKQVKFVFTKPKDRISVKLNKELYGWVLENLVKNALDAMQGKGRVEVDVTRNTSHAIIKVRDTGKGIPKSMQKKIFNPGFTTKKRGWGLGLSLSKRIIEDFHNGKIEVIYAEQHQGSCIQVSIPMVV